MDGSARRDEQQVNSLARPRASRSPGQHIQSKTGQTGKTEAAEEKPLLYRIQVMQLKVSSHSELLSFLFGCHSRDNLIQLFERSIYLDQDEGPFSVEYPVVFPLQPFQ